MRVVIAGGRPAGPQMPMPPGAFSKPGTTSWMVGMSGISSQRLGSITARIFSLPLFT